MESGRGGEWERGRDFGELNWLGFGLIMGGMGEKSLIVFSAISAVFGGLSLAFWFAGALIGPTVVWAGLASRPAELPLPVDVRQEAELLRVAGAGFQLKRTPHFLVAFNTSRGTVDELTARLEETYHSIYRFAEAAGIKARRPGRRLEVLFFDAREEYEKYGAGVRFPAGGTYGLYHEETNRSAFFNAHNEPQLLQLHAEIGAARESLRELSRMFASMKGNQPVTLSYADGRRETLTRGQAKKRLEAAQRELKILDGKRINYSERINRTVIQHEAAHQVLFNAGVHVRGGANPKWIVEGLACLFETPPGLAGGGIAATNQFRLRDFRSAVEEHSGKRLPGAEDFLAAVRAGRFVEPERLITDPGVFHERERRGAEVYAMTWSLTHYLQRCRPKELAGYLAELSNRRPGEAVSASEEQALFEKHFGALDDVFIRQWGGYTLGLGYREPGGL